MAKCLSALTATGMLMATLVLAQEKPNFAGAWTPVEGVNPPVDLVVTQTATLLKAKAGDDPEHAAQYHLDGQESRQSGGNVRTRTQWEGNRLLVTHEFMAGSTIVNTQKQVWSLDAQGRLVIETTRERDGQTRATKSVYKRRPR
jgi:hypothetical protein